MKKSKPHKKVKKSTNTLSALEQLKETMKAEMVANDSAISAKPAPVAKETAKAPAPQPKKPVAEALPKPVFKEELPAPAKKEALAAPSVKEALAAPEKKEALAAPEKKEALSAPAVHEALTDQNVSNMEQKNTSTSSVEPSMTSSSTPNSATVSTPAAKDSVAKAVHSPDPAEWTALILRLADRTHQALKAFIDRNKSIADKIPSFDPAHLSEAFLEMADRLNKTPERVVETHLSFMQDYIRLLQANLAHMSGQKAEPVIAAQKGDKRFQDPAWQEIWLFDFIKQSYLLMARWAQSLVQGAEGLDPKILRKIDFYTRQVVDAVSPSNFWMTNPAVLRTTLESNGENLIRGLENLLDDIERGQGQLLISMTTPGAFRCGDNIALTPGKVVYQNELIQLLQYAPTTDKVRKTPLLICPPWINKFYILDLGKKNSFIKYLVDQGHTVFCISWVNPDHRHANTTFADYMTLGPLTALKQVSAITGENEVNMIGYCIGGTLLATMMAWLKARDNKDQKGETVPHIKSATFLTTLLDFSEPGDIGVFIDESQIEMIEALMKDQGYMAAAMMATTFNMLRSNDLIWSFVVNNYLLGKEPFPFDLLAWNADSTNLPAAMQSYYLRNMYLENNLVKPDVITVDGTPVDLRRITTPTCFLSTREDHIAPWKSTYAATQLFQGPVRFILSGSGHIAGVINPPEKNKYGYWTNEECPSTPDAFLKNAEAHTGSWWPEWIKWVEQYAGGEVAPRTPGDNAQVIEDAPGSYVRTRVL